MLFMCRTWNYDRFCDAGATHHASLLNFTLFSVWFGFVQQSIFLRLEYKRKRSRIIVYFLSISTSPQRADFLFPNMKGLGKCLLHTTGICSLGWNRSNQSLVFWSSAKNNSLRGCLRETPEGFSSSCLK